MTFSSLSGASGSLSLSGVPVSLTDNLSIGDVAIYNAALPDDVTSGVFVRGTGGQLRMFTQRLTGAVSISPVNLTDTSELYGQIRVKIR